jgi:GH25 family lysozyme M1 (1,4-beta-N-acetylmuramidase)
MRRPITAASAILVLTLGALATTAAAGASGGRADASVTGASVTGASVTGASVTGATYRGHISRFNEDATHSPELERRLAGHAVAPSAAARARPAGLASSASAVEGIDVASLQHPKAAPIDWTQVAQAQYKFAFIKVSEGSYYVNPYYASDASGAKSAGLFVAPYAFAIPNYSGGAFQADYALDQARYAADGQTLPLILDIEYDPYDSAPPGGDGTNECYGLSPAQMVAWIAAFTAEADRRTGQLPVIYTTQDWWAKCTGDSSAFTADPLWVASFVSSPVVPDPWTSDWTYWQYTASAKPPGVSVATDASWLSSTALELAAPASRSDPTGTQASLQLHALDGGAPITYSQTGLPPGVQLGASTGALAGQLPGSAAPFLVAVTASAAGDPSVTQSFAWDVHGKVALGKLTRRTGSVGAPVQYHVRAADGLAGCTLRFSASGLPPGLAISSCGWISGWPSSSGHYTVRVHVSDSSGAALATGSFRWQLRRANGRGPAGHIRLGRDGKCLAALSASDIAIGRCSSAASQQWTIAADGSVQVGGSCLAAKPASSSASGALELTSCTGRQRWQLGSNAVLTNLGDGHCLSDTGRKNGARAVAAVCQATPNNTGSASTPSTSQQWILPAGPLTSGIAGYCASSLRAAGDQAGAVTLRPCNGTGRQAWTIEPDGALTSGGKCLDLTSDATVPGTRVRLVACAQSAGQVWQLAGGPLGAHIVSPVAGLCLADPGDRAKGGTQLTVEPCVASDPGISWRAS